MAAIVLDGTPLLEETKADLSVRVARCEGNGVTPGLGTILVGEDPNSAAYVRQKHELCEELGIASFHQDVPSTGEQRDLISAVGRFNSNDAVHAFLVQIPLPRGFDKDEALLAIDPAKDVDGLHPVNLGRLMIGAQGPRPCTPLGIQALIAHYGVPIEGKHVVIIGRGITSGRPLADLLSLKEPNANAATTVVHTGVEDIAAYTRQADIVVAAAGVPRFVTKEMVKPGAAVVSVGITWKGRRTLVPDVDEGVADVAGWITPRVGGVGPTTVAMLLSNCVAAAEKRLNT